MNAVLRSWSVVKSHSDSSDVLLSLKLSMHLAKSFNQGIQDGTITASIIEQNTSEIKELKDLSLKERECSENSQAWNIWKTIQSSLQHQDKLSHEAKFSMDPVISLISDWGTDDNADDPINLRSLSKDQISQLSFLVAGVGDGCHGFGTIIGLGKAYNKLSAAQKKDIKVHVTLLNIHSLVIMRNLILFMLIEKLIVAEKVDPQMHLEIQATLINSIKPIIPIIDFGLTNTMTSSTLLQNMKHKSSAENIKLLIQSDYPGIRKSLAGQCWEAEQSLKSLSNETLVYLRRVMHWPELAISSPRTLRQMLNMEKHWEQVVNFMMMAQFDQNIELRLTLEEEWYGEVDVFIPPTFLLSKHPGFEAFSNIIHCIAENVDGAKLKKMVLKDWKTNMTILDAMGGDSINILIDTFGIIQQTGLFNKKHSLKNNDPQGESKWPAYSYVTTFFDGIIDAIKSMHQEKGLKVKLICREVNQELLKVWLGTDSKPTEFPKKFTRIWLSNILDYTHGTLSTAMCMLLALQDDMDFSVTSNFIHSFFPKTSSAT
ncbi:hypothetical protein CPB84DRAFT_1745711 [Gymnopilus junonius]|uniref:Uncharacterized protein n=1 Tax=Gymnopilus junonius TaxID=109634 RepID=A0A9P5TQD9_GYMJU|nr:hypothetical protein CPB84DRAFT_1745711 [Gymnopilus junonius]